MNLNRYTAIGKLEGDPQVTTNPATQKKQAFFTLIVIQRIQNANGQWVDSTIKVPCFAFDKRAETIGQYLKANQEVCVEGYYRNWKGQNDVEGHGIIVQQTSFGYRPKDQG